MISKANKSVFVNIVLHIAGLLLCIVPPAVCTLCYFPLWNSVDYESCIAGGVALLLAVCAVPLYKLIARAIQSYSAFVMWLISFLLFFSLSKIANEMTVISFVGFVSNLLGAIVFKIAKRGDVSRGV